MNLVKVRYIIEDSLTKIKVTFFLYYKKNFSFLNPNIFYVNGRDANRHPIIGKIHVKIVHSLSLFLYLSHTHARSRARALLHELHTRFLFLPIFYIFSKIVIEHKKQTFDITRSYRGKKKYILRYMEICINMYNLHKTIINVQFSFTFDSIFFLKKYDRLKKK